MWCPHCQSETNAVGSGLSEQLRCESCGKAFISGKPSDNSIRQARDIIARWSSDDLLDRITSLPSIPPMPRPHFAKQPAAEEQPSAELPTEQHEQEATPEQTSDGGNERANASEVAINAEAATDAEVDTVAEVASDTVVAVEATDQQPEAAAPSTESESESAKEAQPKVTASTPPPAVHTPSVEELSRQFGLSADRPKFFSASTQANKTPSESPARHELPEPSEAESVVDSKAETGPAEEAIQDESPSQLPQTNEATAPAAGFDDSAPEDTQAAESSVSLQPPPSGQSETVEALEIPEGEPTALAEVTQLKPVATETNHTIIPLKQGQRRPQRRNSQQRKQLERRSTVNDTDKGRTPVSRKYRVDSPGEDTPDVASEATQSSSGSRIQSNSTSDGRRYRIDDGEQVQQTLGTGDGRIRTDGRSRDRFIDEAHETALRGPHFQVTAPKRSNLTSLTGQFLAYLGVLGLTIGTAMVIYGHFGGYSEYTPTGWLVTTVAQMMLFLGVINLVSGGMEQNNDDVSARINTLGEQLMRIEQVTEQALRGPKISPRRYADPDAPVEESQREAVTIGERK